MLHIFFKAMGCQLEKRLGKISTVLGRMFTSHGEQ